MNMIDEFFLIQLTVDLNRGDNIDLLLTNDLIVTIHY